MERLALVPLQESKSANSRLEVQTSIGSFMPELFNISYPLY